MEPPEEDEEDEGRHSDASRRVSADVLLDPELWATVLLILVVLALIG